MQRRNPGSTAALLQKANSQLKGEKITKPEDELNAYINSLTQKTSQQKKSVNFDDLSESISISSNIDDTGYQAKSEVATSSGSKFLKKKTSLNEYDSTPVPTANKFLKISQPAGGNSIPSASTNRQHNVHAQSMGSSRPGSQIATGRQASSALDKASAITGKIQQRVATRRSYTLESDSDESFSALKMAKSSTEQVSDSQASDSMKIGRDKGKFLKKATPSPVPAAMQSYEPPITSQGKSSAKQQAKQSQKVLPFQLKSSLKYSTDVVLTSEEESLAEFVGGLPSSSDSQEMSRKQIGKHVRHSPSPPPTKHGKSRQSASPPIAKTTGQSVPSQSKPPLVRRTPSPSPRTADHQSPQLRRRSPSPKLMRSYSDDSNVAESIKDEIVEDVDIGVHVILDMDELGPVDEEIPPHPGTQISKNVSPIRSTARSSQRPENMKAIKSALKSPSKTAGKKPTNQSSLLNTKNETGKGTSQSPFKATSGSLNSPFKAGSSNNFLFKAEDNGSPFKANNESRSLFKADFNSSVKEKVVDSIHSNNEQSIFKAALNTCSPFQAVRSDKRDKTQKKKSKKSKSMKQANKTDVSKKNAAQDLFSSLGIHTIEDLQDQQSARESEYESVYSEIEEIKSNISEEIKTENQGAFSYSQKFEDSRTEIVSEIDEPKQTAPSCTDDSISEKIGYSSDKGKSSASEVRTKYSDTASSMTEISESDTESDDVSSKTKDSDQDKTYSESYTSYTEDFTKSIVPTSSSAMTPRPPRKMATAQVQTSLDGLHYSWNNMNPVYAFPSIPYGLHFVDPTPIATHVVSADDLEALTAYSPAMLAMHDMLKAQMELTREFLDSQKKLYSEISDSIQLSYYYTTLEDTKMVKIAANLSLLCFF